MAEEAAFTGKFDKKEVIRQANALVHKAHGGNTLDLLAAAYALQAIFDIDYARKAAEAAEMAAKIVREDADVRRDFEILAMAAKQEQWAGNATVRDDILGELIRGE